MTQAPARQHDLDDVLYQFALDHPRPDAEALERYSQAHPEFAAELTLLAIDLALELEETATPAAASVRTTEDEEAVLNAMSRFHNALFHRADSAKATTESREASVRDPFEGLDRAGFRAIADQLDANSVFVMKLRDRRVRPETMTPGFLALAARTLRSGLDELSAYLTLPAVLAQARSYKAEGKPTVSEKESFEDAVRGSGLTAEQQRRLLEL